ncbi:bifunctional hydroxymethylpyrimidine kinase/phosphomethylpyrimidine kinase [Treponema sp. C6A8]|uniref:bifunctional hydroxymethylpyrimidine kinase/phosphomethylpyrimidine kinase n=1 Tax=Treponema sp. C6A8 TaxID=1410609 RepID=UPI000489BCD2|nr:bifunctional hydroxymethylpyrimidine kinase/phosphomethylpyrimidine kinase [Treponema sp. C6A8]
MNTALTIAGSDSSGGAGIQADIKTMTCNGIYAMSAITALTAQNTTGVTAIMEVKPEFLKEQIKAVVSDIFPDAVKTGMVSSSALIKVISDSIKEYGLKNIVVDPVMVATSGAKLITDDAIESLKKELLPLATVITPNIPEAEVLFGSKITSEEDMEKTAKEISKNFGCAVLLKGGHSLNDANDYLYDDKGSGDAKEGIWFYGKKINNPNTHGTGCTLSSAIAANLAKGLSLSDAVKNAKDYISGALEAMLDLGKGSGPLAHNWNLK